MKTKEQIIEKINEYYKLSPEMQMHPRNLGYCDALRWVIEKEGFGYEKREKEVIWKGE